MWKRTDSDLSQVMPLNESPSFTCCAGRGPLADGDELGAGALLVSREQPISARAAKSVAPRPRRRQVWLMGLLCPERGADRDDRTIQRRARAHAAFRSVRLNPERGRRRMDN